MQRVNGIGGVFFAARDPAMLDSPQLAELDSTWSVNFRVDDLEAMVAQLQSRGVRVAGADLGTDSAGQPD